MIHKCQKILRVAINFYDFRWFAIILHHVLSSVKCQVSSVKCQVSTYITWGIYWGFQDYRLSMVRLDFMTLSFIVTFRINIPNHLTSTYQCPLQPADDTHVKIHAGLIECVHSEPYTLPRDRSALRYRLAEITRFTIKMYETSQYLILDFIMRRVNTWWV